MGGVVKSAKKVVGNDLTDIPLKATNKKLGSAVPALKPVTDRFNNSLNPVSGPIDTFQQDKQTLLPDPGQDLTEVPTPDVPTQADAVPAAAEAHRQLARRRRGRAANILTSESGLGGVARTLKRVLGG